MTLLAPRILNDVSYVTRINHEMHFAWQAQYLVKLECDFSWQAQHLVTFWEIAGAHYWDLRLNNIIGRLLGFTYISQKIPERTVDAIIMHLHFLSRYFFMSSSKEDLPKFRVTKF